MKIENFKCPSCGAPLVFSGEEQGLECSSCGSKFSAETLKDLDENDYSSYYDWEEYSERSYGEEEGVNLSEYSCPSCGAEICGSENTGAAVCPYCGNSTIVEKQFEGGLKPDFVVPFKVEKKQAMDILKKSCKGKMFIPPAFKAIKKFEKITGLYVPYWVFSCDTYSRANMTGYREETWSDDRYIYTKTDHYRLYREGEAEFLNIPVDGSAGVEDCYMEGIEPFDYSLAVDFNTAYLSGYLAEKYDVGKEVCQNRANERIESSLRSALTREAMGFSGVSITDFGASLTGSKVRYGLMPVWMLNVLYKGERYTFAINGQTGKVAGKYPVSWGKFWLWFLGLSAGFAALGFVILAIINS